MVSSYLRPFRCMYYPVLCVLFIPMLGQICCSPTFWCSAAGDHTTAVVLFMFIYLLILCWTIIKEVTWIMWIFILYVIVCVLVYLYCHMLILLCEQDVVSSTSGERLKLWSDQGWVTNTCFGGKHRTFGGKHRTFGRKHRSFGGKLFCI